MEIEGEERIWFHPTRFWELTKNMPEEEVERLFERVYRLAEQRNLDALRGFEFISVGKLRRSNTSVLATVGH